MPSRISKLNLASIFLILGLLGAGCASALNPYDSEFKCPKTPNGKCGSVDAAYEDSLAKTGKKNDAVKTQCENGRCINKNGVNRDSASKDKDFAGTDLYNIEYQTEVFKKLSGLLRDPVTPVIAPPVVMRVLILPYKGDENELYLNRYVLLLVDQPKWVMGDYLFNSEGAGR